MRLLRLRLSGLNRQSMLTGFAAPSATNRQLRLTMSGSIGDRPFIRSITVGSGKSFISANVGVRGGHGVAIAPQPISTMPVHQDHQPMTISFECFVIGLGRRFVSQHLMPQSAAESPPYRFEAF